jgi:riboflavin kinase / FMN adenylyltransferase
LLGYDNKIGHGGKGHFQQIQHLSEKFHFRVETLAALKNGDEQVSSTRIRELLAHGDIPGANKLLGYHFGMNGTVVYGQRLGTSLGFPTANIMPHTDKFIPGVGVYAIRGYWDGQIFNGMMNIGYRPTVSKEERKLVLEAHLFNFDENIYDKELKIEFVEKMRDEKSFKSIDELRAQLQLDKVKAKEILTKLFNR